jgi:hypothetical protein
MSVISSPISATRIIALTSLRTHAAVSYVVSVLDEDALHETYGEVGV